MLPSCMTVMRRSAYGRNWKRMQRARALLRRKEDSLQFFKEESVDGAVYNLYLKKVRYHTPTDDGTDLDDDKVSHLQWRTLEIKIIKAGTLYRLVQALSTDTGEIDSTYVNVFLATFRAFATTKEVLRAILDRYIEIGDDIDMKQESKEGHRKALRIVISVWLDGYADDFREIPKFQSLKQLREFAERHMEGSDLAQRAQHRMEKFQREEDVNGVIIAVEDIEFHFNILDEVSFQMNEEEALQRPVELETIPERIFAEQLTYMDSELFKKVVPHHCMGYMWSRRDKKRLHAPSVFATVNQFNAVSYRVIATVLKHPLDIRRTERARIIEKWINIAQELRSLKNFSSLKAIISGLQSNPVYRLRKIWAEVDKDSMTQFNELAEIFSENNNQMQARELLMKEGTAKFADVDSSTLGRRRKSSNLQKRKSVIDPTYNSVQGTVPYLGTFLTDLTMFDAAIPDTTEEGLINFEKRRKEFEILAQIRLLQSAAQLYQLKPDQAFFEWFHNLRVYDDNESYELSCEIEPVTPSTPKEVKGHRKKSSLGFFSPRRPASMGDDLTLSSPSILSTDSDDSAMTAPSTPADGTDSGFLKPHFIRHSMSMTSLKSADEVSLSPWRSPETCVVKCAMETSEVHYTNLYKSILLHNSDHTKSVIRNILLKFDINGRPEDYVIFQALPDQDLQIPDKGNVFYAINTSTPELKLIIRKRSDLERIKAKQKKKKQAINSKFTL